MVPFLTILNFVFCILYLYLWHFVFLLQDGRPIREFWANYCKKGGLANLLSALIDNLTAFEKLKTDSVIWATIMMGMRTGAIRGEMGFREALTKKKTNCDLPCQLFSFWSRNLWHIEHQDICHFQQADFILISSSWSLELFVIQILPLILQPT